jgi:hypothetical protein
MLAYRIVATPFCHPFGEAVWALTSFVETPQCVPLSALGAVLHQWPALFEKKEGLFAVLREAYLARNTTCQSMYHFKEDTLAVLGLQQKLGVAVSVGESDDGFHHALDQTLQWVQNRQYGKHTAFELMIYPKDKSETYHAITVTCDGLRFRHGGVGFQETAYSDGEKGKPMRYQRLFSDRQSFADALCAFVMTPAVLGYPAASIQVVLFEKQPDSRETSLAKLCQLLSGGLFAPVKQSMGTLF